MRRLAYLFPAFPVLHQTFTLFEVVGLKCRGYEIGLFSLRSGGGGHPATWRTHLTGLLDDAGERRRLGERARAVIDGGIWADVQYPRLKRILLGE